MKNCNQCGKCCLKYSDGGLSATADEIESWRTFSPHIYQYVSDGKIWMDPVSGDQLKVCPWLEKAPGQNKYTCAIYQQRPEDCRFYPSNIEEMIRDECEMLEPEDLINQKRAQKCLDKLMASSRE